MNLKILLDSNRREMEISPMHNIHHKKRWFHCIKGKYSSSKKKDCSIFSLVNVTFSFLLITSLIVFFIGCFFQQRGRVRYYTLSYTPKRVLSSSSMTRKPRSLRIERVEVPRLFDRTNIIYRESPQEIQFYPQYQWAVQPSDMITDTIEKHIISSNLFTDISREFLDFRPEYRFECSIQALERFNAKNTWFGHLSMIMRLINVADGKQVWQHSFDERRRVTRPEMVYTVQALTQIIETQMDVVINNLNSYFVAVDGDSTSSTLVAETKSVDGDKIEGITLDKDSYTFIPVRGTSTVLDTTKTEE